MEDEADEDVMTAAVLVAATEVSTAFAVVRMAAVVVYEDAVEKETVEKGSEDAEVAPAYATRLDAGASAMSWLRLNGTNGFNTLAKGQQSPPFFFLGSRESLRYQQLTCR